MRPDVARYSPSNSRIVVDFPAPFGPRNPNTSPAATSKLTSVTPRCDPNRRVRCSTLTTVSAGLSCLVICPTPCPSSGTNGHPSRPASPTSPVDRRQGLWFACGVSEGVKRGDQFASPLAWHGGHDACDFHAPALGDDVHDPCAFARQAEEHLATVGRVLPAGDQAGDQQPIDHPQRGRGVDVQFLGQAVQVDLSSAVQDHECPELCDGDGLLDLCE